MKRLAAMATVVLFAPLASAQPAPRFVDIERADQAVTARAFQAFRQHCPGLSKLGPLVEQVSVRDVAIPLGDEVEDRGWTIAVSVEIKFRRAATSMAFDLGVPLLSDYIFLIGAGHAPGILSSATTGLRLCVPHYDGNFMPVPELRLPTEFPSNAADERAHPGRKLDSTNYPLGEGPLIPPSPSGR